MKEPSGAFVSLQLMIFIFPHKSEAKVPGHTIIGSSHCIIESWANLLEKGLALLAWRSIGQRW